MLPWGQAAEPLILRLHKSSEDRVQKSPQHNNCDFVYFCSIFANSKCSTLSHLQAHKRSGQLGCCDSSEPGSQGALPPVHTVDRLSIFAHLLCSIVRSTVPLKCRKCNGNIQSSVNTASAFCQTRFRYQPAAKCLTFRRDVSAAEQRAQSCG